MGLSPRHLSGQVIKWKTCAGLDRFGDAAALQWAKPQGYDDKKDADACVNAVPAEPHYLKLVGTFKKYVLQ
jgi:hypothetical protein